MNTASVSNNDEHDLDLPLIPMLTGYVYKDIWEEEWKKIIKENTTLDFKRMKNMVLVRCKAVLQQIITNNGLLGND